MRIDEGLVQVMNIFGGWDLEFLQGSKMTAKGKTPKGFECVFKVQLSRENKAPYMSVEDKREFDKHDVVKVYCFQNSKANYWYWLNDMELKETEGNIKLEIEDAKIIEYKN